MPRAAKCLQRMFRHRNLWTWSIACTFLLWPDALRGQTVGVRYAEGLVHGFLVLRALDGTPLADGDLIQTTQGVRVTSRLVFHFKDGSLHDETVIYSQRQRFQLSAIISCRRVQPFSSRSTCPSMARTGE
jgi:hypothetical protein